MKEKLQIMGIVLALIVIVLVLWGQIGGKQPVIIGSAVDGQTYNSTTTRAYAGATISNFAVIKPGPGTLGSVINFSGSATGVVYLYDATTTDITKRTGNTATSSIIIATIPGSYDMGAYVFDVGFNNGLLYELVSGSVGTSTITYR